MIKRISTTLAAGTLVALLTACGHGLTAQGTSDAPAAPPSTASAAATPSASSPPVDETKTVQTASKRFVLAALTVGYPDDASDYAGRVEPLMTKQGYAKWKAAVPFDVAVKTQRSRFGQRVRSAPHLLGAAKVTALSADKAATELKFESQIQRRSGSSWKVVKRSVDDTFRLQLVRENGAWLVDDLG